MNNILLNKKETIEYMKETINELKIKPYITKNAKYHHNTNYHNAVHICQYGILTLSDLNKLGIKNYSEETLKKVADTNSHINGIDHVSLAVMELTDLYHDEEEFDSFNPKYVDFLITDDIPAYRTSLHYGNEYIHPNSITIDKLRTIDIRIIKLINLLEQKNLKYNITLEEIIKNYNYLKDIAIAIKTYKLNIPIREMSDNNHNAIDIDKLSTIPKLVLKQ